MEHFSKSDLVSFGEYLLSEKRRNLYKAYPAAGSLPPLRDRLSQVNHADVENWLAEYFARKVDEEMDKLWEEEGWTKETIEGWKKEHLRSYPNHK